MSVHQPVVLSVVVPLYNESAGLERFHNDLVAAVETAVGQDYEVIYCNDGSSDHTAQLVHDFRKANSRVKLMSFSRNFGKEIATTAGIHHASGQAILTIDADGQHPIDRIPEFVDTWQSGRKVVIGLRTGNQNEGPLKRYGSKLFYMIFNRLTGMKLVAGASDFRLIDRSIQQEFSRMTERNRITRGLIDWLGYKPAYIHFRANPRLSGDASYTFSKLVKLAVDSVISLSLSPLYISAYIGAVVLPLASIIGLFMVIDALVGDPLGVHATGSAYLVVLLLFLVGVLLLSQGIIGLYLSHIHTETQNRPLYVIDNEISEGL